MRWLATGFAILSGLLGLSPAAHPATPISPTLQLLSSGSAPQVRTDRYVMRSSRASRDFLVEVTHPGPVGIQSGDTPARPDQKFPAIYALDGGYGLIGPATRLLTAFGNIAPSYVVAIGYPNDSGNHIGPREVDLIHVHIAQKSPDGRPAGDGGAALEAFLIEDLRPFLEKRYPLDPNQAVLFGHSLGGLFAATVLVNRPESFTGYIIGSPTLGNDLSILAKAKAIAPKGAGRRVFVTSAPLDLVSSRAEAFVQALSGPDSRFLVRHRVFQDLGHGSSYMAIPQTVFPFLLPVTVPAAASRKAIALDAATLRRYAGAYLMEPGTPVKLTSENIHLFGQMGGQQEFEIFPQSETKFFLKAADAQITFVKDDAGNVTGFVLHQNGRNLQATRTGQ